MTSLNPQSTAQPLDDVPAAEPPALIWEERPDGLFIQIPPAAREKMSSGPDRAVFRWFMIFAFFSIVAASAWFAGEMSPIATLVFLAIIVLVGALLYRAMTKRKSVLSTAHLPSTIEISGGNLSVDVPHPPDGGKFSVPVAQVRDLCACLSRLEGFGVSPLGAVEMYVGGGVRLTVELDTNKAHDVIIKCNLTEAQILQLETDLRKTLGLAPLKPP